MLECAFLKCAFLLMPFSSQSQGGHPGVSLIVRPEVAGTCTGGCRASEPSSPSMVYKDQDCQTAALAPGTLLFLCFCCSAVTIVTELPFTLSCAGHGLESGLWAPLCAACVLTSSFAFGTNEQTTSFISCMCRRYPSSLSIPCSFPLQILLLLTEPACRQAGGSPVQVSPFLCCFPLHWAGNCQQSKGSRAEASASPAHLSHCPAQPQVRLKPKDLMKQRRTATLLT